MSLLPIHFILTGGTIDSETQGQTRDVIRKHSAVPDFIKSLKGRSEWEFTEVMMKDSRDITNDDRSRILEVVESSNCNRIIITHGTFTMAETARYIKQRLSGKKKIVILTGSLVPLMGFADSDAPRNLEFAILQSQILFPGVYVSMNEKNFDAEEAVKDSQTGIFYSIKDFDGKK